MPSMPFLGLLSGILLGFLGGGLLVFGLIPVWALTFWAARHVLLPRMPAITAPAASKFFG